MSVKEFFSVPSSSSFYPVSIPYSCRFDSARSCYLSRTPGGAGNRKTWTLSFWFKPCSFGLHGILGAGDGSTANNMFRLYYSVGALIFDSRNSSGTTNACKLTYDNRLLRDPSAWYHILYSVDTTQAENADRIKLYINNTLCGFDTVSNVDVAQNTDMAWNMAQAHRIGECMDTTWMYPLPAYLSEFFFIDGAALTPSTFGQFSTQNSSVWVPKTPTGLTYGTNGFHLDFANAADLGNDVSGNNNDYTSSGLASTDQMLDTPTNNFCTLNPMLGTVANHAAYSNGNLVYNCASGFNLSATMQVSSGKFYFEFTPLTISGAMYLGLWDVNLQTNATLRAYFSDGTYFNGTSSIGYGAAYTANDVIGCAFDLDSQTIEFFKNNTSQGVKTSVGISVASLASHLNNASNTGRLNFGANGFAYTPPTGFKALCTSNLEVPLDAIATSGTFTGNANADGPFVYTGGTPDSLSIDSNAVTWGTHADKLANGFKIRTASAGYNDVAANNWTAVTTLDRRFPYNNAQGNP